MSDSPVQRSVHPSLFMILFLPFGISSGYVIVTLAWLLAHNNVSTANIAGMVAISYLPHTFKVFWAPAIDTMLSNRIWYLLSTLVTGVLTIMSGLVPMDTEHLPLMSALVFSFNVSLTFLGMSVESLMAHATPEDQKGRVGGWFQAGNLGGQGLGGGLGLWLAQHFDAPWIAGVGLGAVSLACALGLYFVVQPPRENHPLNYLQTLKDLVRDVWSAISSRAGALAALLLFLPIGSGSAQNLWSAVSNDWHASVEAVELVNGVFSGLISAAGCLIGGYFCDRMDRRTAYALFGVLLAASAVLMAFAPRTEMMFIVFTCLYAFIVGLTYVGFTAVVLEAIGKGAAATKYNLYASLSNIPIAWVTTLDGYARTKWGTSAMLFADAGVGIAGIGVFAVIALATRGMKFPSLWARAS